MSSVRTRLIFVAMILLVLLAIPALSAARQSADAIAEETSRADRLYAEGSYRLAHEAYLAVDGTDLDENEQAWLRFRIADTKWRSEVADPSPDTTPVDQARRALQELLAELSANAEPPLLWAEIQESLGDSWWNAAYQNWHAAWQHYAQALEWWGRSSDLERARERYLRIVRSASEPPVAQPWISRGHYAQSVPQPVLENAVSIARSADDRAYMNYLLALRLRYSSEPRSVERMHQAFERALAAGRQAEWYDDALFAFAQTLEQQGSLVHENGRWTRVPDPERALELYRRLLAEFRPGESRHRDDAESRVRDITEPSLQISVSNVFLPGSKIAVHLNWRNIDAVQFDLRKVDLTRAVTLNTNHGINHWIDRITVDGASTVRSWSRDLESRPYVPASDVVKLDELPMGAYLLEARSGTTSARELILVTDVAVVLKTAPDQVITWVTDARTGEPVSGARTRLWEEYHDNAIRHRSQDGITDASGLFISDRQPRGTGRQILAIVNRNGRQAFAQTWSYTPSLENEQWRIDVTTDRPAYRPGDTASWKVIARTLDADRAYSTPAGRELRWELYDPLGNKSSEGKLNLNEFGSAWTEIPLDETMPLGLYQIRFLDQSGRYLGGAPLLRLEEYKLPEYAVTVGPADPAEGERKIYRTGDEIEVEVRAEYYFGGPVANAEVHVVVRQQPLVSTWHWPREYPWYYESHSRPYGWYGAGQEVVSTTLKTDSEGVATFKFDTPDGDQDYRYTVEARVVDASRREIVGSSTINVTVRPFIAHVRPGSFLHRPRDEVEIELRTIDANDEPVSANGTLVVTRDTWREVWIDPKGNRVGGAELDELRARVGVFPPPQQPDQHPWRLISRGYEHEEIERVSLSTGDDGEATWTFEPRREGYYRFVWTSEPPKVRYPSPRDVVTAETTVWVADHSSRDLGYRSSGVELIVDDDSFRSGASSPVMIVTESPGTWVLFSLERESILEHRVIRQRGNVTLVDLEITDRHVPNVFASAAMVRDLQMSLDTEEIIVPPVDHFLEVTVELDRESYEPGETGAIKVTTRNAAGEPVAAEVSLAVSDESVSYIQESLSRDPRQVFYGDKRPHWVQTTSSFQHQAYVKLAEDENGALIDERRLVGARADAYGVEGGVVGGVADGVSGAVPPPPPPPAAPSAVAESITVTSSAPQVERQASAKMAANAMDERQEMDAAAGSQVTVRSDFRATALWEPAIRTGSDGSATIDVRWPDSLTSWSASARAVTTGADFGAGDDAARTRKPLIVRLQSPRFFVVGDEVTISAIVNNNTEADVRLAPELEVEGLRFLSGSGVEAAVIPAGGDARFDWRVAAREAGRATLQVRAGSGDLADAMEQSFLVWDHGIEKTIATSSSFRGTESVSRIDLPRERRPGSTTMEVVVTPSVALTMLDALPYLFDYPYGCTEQTMSRFLPAAIVLRTLHDRGVPRELVAARMFGGIEPESASATHPGGAKELAILDDVIRKGLARLYDFQQPDGGWGWWKEGDADPWMTAYVVWGLDLAREGGVSIRSGVIERAVSWLDQHLVEGETNLNLQAWMLHAVTTADEGRSNEMRDRVFANLWKNRDQLTAYGRALLTLSADALGRNEEAAVLVRNLENGVTFDQAPEESVLLSGRRSRSADTMATAHWGSTGFWWRWYDGPVETTSFVLQALVAVDPDHRLVQPAMNWLVRNRRGAQWNNTRDTAIAVLSLNDYLETSGELKGSSSYIVSVNGREVGRGNFTPETIFTARTLFPVPANAIRDGKNEIRVERVSSDASPLYVSTAASFFSVEEPITAEGNEIFVKREYFRLVPRETLLAGVVYDRVPLLDGESIVSGERVDVVVTVETKNDYEYLLFEDLKPAGFEAVAVRSGESLSAVRMRADAVDSRFGEGAEPARRGRPVEQGIGWHRVHQELRDRKVAMFVDELEQGVWEIRYTLRAEVPGTFHALPLLGEAMYVPEIRANSDELRVEVREGEAPAEP